MPDSSQFGRYEVEEEVARGGMGVIYRVRDPEMRRFLAMKVLLSDPVEEADDSDSQHSKLASRFIDEAQLTGQLDHPGIIPVYDMGRDADGRLFFTMRLVKGRTLEEIFDLVRDGKEGWSMTRALGVLQKVSEAVAFAHEHGVIHRDLKPANIMVGRFGETYVMDWGLAKLFDENAVPAAEPESQHDVPSMQTILSSTRQEESTRGGGLETMDGDVMGTPAYMGIEQARGEVHRVGPRSDVYALGAMLYHLLSGHAPYHSPGVQSSGAEVLMRLYAGPPPPIVDEAKNQAAELCAICEHAMAREPEDRYANMLELSEDLHAYVENRVVQAYRQGALIEFKKWVQRNRAMAASLVVLVVFVIAGLGAPSANAELLPHVYAELRAIAGHVFSNRIGNEALQPTVLVHDAYLKLVGCEDEWNNRQHFFAVASIAMRNMLADQARSLHAHKRGGLWNRVTLSQIEPVHQAPGFDLVGLDRALSKLELLSKRQARVVELRYLTGLPVKDVADVLGISVATVGNEWRAARAFLRGELH